MTGMQIFFNSWDALIRTLIVASCAYPTLVILLRVAGKRTLSQWNAFDLVVTVALGSSFASAILSNDVALAQGVLGFLMLVGLQYAVTWSSVRIACVRRFVKSDPAVLLSGGRFNEDSMRRERVTDSEIRAALRARGIARVEDVAAVILETDGTFSVIEEMTGGVPTALRGVAGFDHLARTASNGRVE
jgi:uncharacterized membrane protein YcaP (DUF421 family)